MLGNGDSVPLAVLASAPTARPRRCIDAPSGTSKGQSEKVGWRRPWTGLRSFADARRSADRSPPEWTRQIYEISCSALLRRGKDWRLIANVLLGARARPIVKASSGDPRNDGA